MLHEPAQFQVRSYLPEEIVRDLQKITGRLLLAGTNSKSSQKISSCSIIDETSR